MIFRIRFARVRERKALIALQRRASLIWKEYRAALLAHHDSIDIPIDQVRNRHVRVATAGTGTLGFSALTTIDVETCELDGLFVEPAHWGEGIGRALVEDAIRLARRRKFRVMEVTANPRAERFYAKLGFVKYTVTKTRFGRAPRLRRVLAE